MKVLYGVQATGNGHITRARVMAPALQKAGVDVDYLFSGREPEKLFDMEPFGNYQTRRGLTFYMGKGAKVQRFKTLMNSNLLQLYKDIRQLDLSEYDLIISDFEPITAWAAKIKKKPSLGIAHQYAFLYSLPDGYRSKLLKPGIQTFAPVKQALGVHWHHFEHPILPPLIQPPRYERTDAGHVLVYLPHEDINELYYWFSAFPHIEFRVYCASEEQVRKGNVIFNPLSRDNFEQDLASCRGVISNCGFGLSSEALQYGKKLLAKPMVGHTEQASNAYILKSRKLATIAENIGPEEIGPWLESPHPEVQDYPEVASQLAEWIANGCLSGLNEVRQKIWQTV